MTGISQMPSGPTRNASAALRNIPMWNERPFARFHKMDFARPDAAMRAQVEVTRKTLQEISDWARRSNAATLGDRHRSRSCRFGRSHEVQHK